MNKLMNNHQNSSEYRGSFILMERWFVVRRRFFCWKVLFDGPSVLRRYVGRRKLAFHPAHPERHFDNAGRFVNP
jgi:hypothetical protein